MAITKAASSQGRGATSGMFAINRFVNRWPEATIVLPAILITVFFYARNSAMLNPITVTSILRTMAFPGLVVMGMVLLMIAGEFDISTGAVMSVAAVFAAWLMKNHGVSWPVAALGALGLSMFVGLLNALLCVKVGMFSLIATLGTYYMAHGLSYSFTNGLPIYPLPADVGIIGSFRPLGLSVPIVLMAVLMLVIQFILRQTRWGSMLFATGGNRAAAEMCGIHTARVKTLAFVFTSLMAGISGLLLMSGLPMPAGDPIIGFELQLPIILGVMLGGVSLYGGRGSAIGTAIGVILMQVVASGMIIARFSADFQKAFLALLLLVAASVDVVTHYRRELVIRRDVGPTLCHGLVLSGHGRH